MWLNLAVSVETDRVVRERLIVHRDSVAAKMTPAQIAEAQRMASEWAQSHPSSR
jgi:hypothetical protein